MNTLQGIRILLVEDSPTDALLIEAALADVLDFQHTLVHTERLSDALAHAGTTHFDVTLLDLGLPDAKGLDTFRIFHRQMPEVPVLVLTAQGALPNRVRSLNQGADDFLPKPFALEELEARLWALMRRSQGRQHPRLQCGSLVFDSEGNMIGLHSMK